MRCKGSSAARGGSTGADIQPVPIGRTVDGRVGVKGVGAAGNFRTGEDEAGGTAAASRRSQPRGRGHEAVPRNCLVVENHDRVAAAVFDAVAVAGGNVRRREVFLAVHVGRAVEQGHAATATRGAVGDYGSAIDLQVSLGATHTIAVGIDGLFPAGCDDDAAVKLRVGAIAVDGIVAAGVGPHVAAVHLNMVGTVDGVVVGVGFHETAVDVNAVLAFNGLASRVAGSLGAVGLHMPAVDVDVALCLDAFGQTFPIVGGRAAAGEAAATTGSVHRRAGSLYVDVYEVVVGVGRADGQYAVAGDAAAALTGALAVEVAAVDGDVSVALDAAGGVAVGAAGAAADYRGARASGRKGEVSSVESHIAVGGEALRTSRSRGAGGIDGAAIDFHRAVRLDGDAVGGRLVGHHGGPAHIGGDVAVFNDDREVGLDALAGLSRNGHSDGASVDGDGLVGGQTLAVPASSGEDEIPAVDGDVAVGFNTMRGVCISGVVGVGIVATRACHAQLKGSAVDNHITVCVDGLAASRTARHCDVEVGVTHKAADDGVAVALESGAVRRVSGRHHRGATAVDGDGTPLNVDVRASLDTLGVVSAHRQVDGSAGDGDEAVALEALSVSHGAVHGDAAARDVEVTAAPVNARLGVVDGDGAAENLDVVVGVDAVVGRTRHVDGAAEHTDIVSAEEAVFHGAVEVQRTVAGDDDLPPAVERCLVGTGSAVGQGAGILEG